MFSYAKNLGFSPLILLGFRSVGGISVAKEENVVIGFLFSHSRLL